MPDYQTLRGVVSNLRYIEYLGRTNTGEPMQRYTDKPEAASTVTFEVGGRAVTVISSGLPPISAGDDVEVVGVVDRRGGMEVAQLHNHTTGAAWQFNAWRAAWRSLFR
jgi:hypothetical protein